MFWAGLAGDRSDVIVWFSSERAIELCGCLEFIDRLGATDVIFVDVSRARTAAHNDLAMFGTKFIDVDDLIVSSRVNHRYLEVFEWREVRSANAFARVVSGGVLLPLMESECRATVLAACDSAWKSRWHVEADVTLSVALTTGDVLSRVVTQGLINRLITSGALETRERAGYDLASLWMRTEVRLESPLALARGWSAV